MKDRDAHRSLRTPCTQYESYGMGIFEKGLDCLNSLEIWFLASMIVTMIVSLIALFRAWNHRHDFKKVILSRYKWFGIDHSGSSNTKNAHLPTRSPEFAEPCKCFNELGKDHSFRLGLTAHESFSFPNISLNPIKNMLEERSPERSPERGDMIQLML